MSVSVVRVVGNCLQHLFLGGFLPPLLARRYTQIVVGGGTLWIDAQRFCQFGKRLVELCLSIINDAKGGVRKFVLRSKSRCFLER